MIENEERNKLNDYLNKWISKKIDSELNSLIELKKFKEENPEPVPPMGGGGMPGMM